MSGGQSSHDAECGKFAYPLPCSVVLKPNWKLFSPSSLDNDDIQMAESKKVDEYLCAKVASLKELGLIPTPNKPVLARGEKHDHIYSTAEKATDSYLRLRRKQRDYRKMREREQRIRRSCRMYTAQADLKLQLQRERDASSMRMRLQVRRQLNEAEFRITDAIESLNLCLQQLKQDREFNFGRNE